VAGVLSNAGSGHALTHPFLVFGYHVTGSTGALFLYGIVVGAVALRAVTDTGPAGAGLLYDTRRGVHYPSPPLRGGRGSPRPRWRWATPGPITPRDIDENGSRCRGRTAHRCGDRLG
jgi:hypothetical protein